MRQTFRLSLFLIFVFSTFAFAKDGNYTKTDSLVDINNYFVYQVARERIGWRLKEDGWFVHFISRLTAPTAKSVPLLLFARNRQYLGQTRIKPYSQPDNWESYKIFIPISRLAELPRFFSLSLYALSPVDKNAYIDRCVINEPLIEQPYFIWQYRGFDEAAVMPNGGAGLQLKTRLVSRGIGSRKVRVVLILRDYFHGRPLLSRNSKPIQIIGPVLDGKDDKKRWELTLNVPYELLDHIRPTKWLSVTPGIEISNYGVFPGNIHFRFQAGGTPSLQLDRLHHKSQQYGFDMERLDLMQKFLDSEKER